MALHEYVEGGDSDYLVLERIGDTPANTGGTLACTAGILRARQGRDAEARELFERAVATDSDHVNARAHLGIALLKEGRPRQALDHFEAALR